MELTQNHVLVVDSGITGVASLGYTLLLVFNIYVIFYYGC